MFITTLTDSLGQSSIAPIADLPFAAARKAAQTRDSDVPYTEASFFDVLAGVVQNAAYADEVHEADMIKAATGEIDNLEEIQANITKAELATDMLVTVKNTVLDSYNELMRMTV